MTESTANVFPWPHYKSDTAASEITPGGEEPVRWVSVGVFAPVEATIIAGRLESEGIPAVTQQEAVGAALGLTVGPLGSTRVLVPEPLAEQARAILAETFEEDVEIDEGKEDGAE
ncbi:MAG: DUF2007 domain-containing protein [Anaerolineae bacterium]